MMKLMNKELKDEVMKDMYWNVLMRCNFMKANFSDPFLKELCDLFREKTYSPGEIILQKGHYVENLNFIMQGDIQTFC
jgi:hypothetical protein